MSLEVLHGANAMWTWLIVGGLVLALEILLPGAFLLWMGLAAVLVGVVLAFVNLDVGAQFEIGRAHV